MTTFQISFSGYSETGETIERRFNIIAGHAAENDNNTRSQQGHFLRIESNERVYDFTHDVEHGTVSYQ